MESIERDLSPEEERRWRQNEAHGEVLARRLSRLVLRGYTPVFPCEMDIFDLVHPSKRAVPVQLWPDGQLIDRYPTTVSDGHRTIISPEDEELFARFLARVPPPSVIQKLLAIPVGEVLALATTWLVIFALGSIIAAFGRAAWHFVRGY